MADLSETIKNGYAVSGVRPALSRNGDGVYAGRQKPYFAMPQNRIASLYGKYATDYYAGELQGYDKDNFYAYWPVKLRCMDITRETTGSNLGDDIKSMVVCEPEGVDYVPIGAQVKFASNTWLVTNPANIASILSETIIRRCNAVYRRLDYYGNVLECPFNIPKVQPRGAQDDYTKNMILADHYFTCAMQLNEVSAAIHENTRLILGDAAYSVRGLDNFTQEFTGDFSSTHIIYFQIQREEKTDVYDDMERKIADGLAFSWDITLTGKEIMTIGETYPITPMSVRNGSVVASTTENPVSYMWESSDTSVLEIDKNGVVTAVGEGEATITCRLAQNEEITQTLQITASAATENPVYFIMPSVSAIIYDPSAEGEKISPSTVKVSIFWIQDGVRAAYGAPRLITKEIPEHGIYGQKVNQSVPPASEYNVEIGSDVDATYQIVFEAQNIDKSVFASTAIPVISPRQDTSFFGE